VILLNVYSDGALLLMEEKPVLGRPMWIRLHDAVKPDWFEAIPVRYGRSHEVKVRFSHPAPRIFLRAATHGEDFRLVEDREETTLTQLGQGGLDHRHDAGADGLGERRPCIHDPDQIRVDLP
jgi:hypothetical protein